MNSSRFAQGSTLQKALDPLAVAEEDESGNLHLTVTDFDLTGDLSDEEKLKKEFDLMKTFADGKMTDD